MTTLGGILLVCFSILWIAVMAYEFRGALRARLRLDVPIGQDTPQACFVG